MPWTQTTAIDIGDVVVSPRDATVWVAGKNGTIWFSKKPDKDYAGKDFTQIDASGFSRVGVWITESPGDFPSGELWAVGTNGTVWYCRYDTDKKAFVANWAKTPASGMMDVAVAPDGTIWLVGEDGSIWYSKDRAKTFQKTGANGMSRVSVGPDNRLWAVGSNGTLWNYDLKKAPSQWVQTGATGMGDVGVGPFGTVWVAGKNGTIWFTTDNGQNFTQIDASGFESIAAGTLNSGVSVWGVGSNGTLWYKTSEFAQVTSTAYFNIQVDKDLGQAGVDVANGLAEVVDGIYKDQAALFDLSNMPAPIALTVHAMTGGGLSGSGGTIDIYAGTDVHEARYVFAMEIAEICMRAQGGGWDPTNSKGEALSRRLAEETYPGTATKYTGYLSASDWLNAIDRWQADFVTTNENTDKNFVSFGCAILFINYMIDQLGFDLKQIVTDKSQALSDIYGNLTGKNDAFGPFVDLLEANFPAKKSNSFTVPKSYPYSLASDNPFPL